MIRINENFGKLQASYLFSDIAKRLATYQQANPDKTIIKLGIGDVTRGLPPACVEAFHKGVDEQAQDDTFRGYGPEQGYAFLREKIAATDFQAREAEISADEIYVSDGAKCDTANFQELFAADIKIAIPDPVYPVYLDTNVMAGRTGAFENGRYAGVTYMEGNRENGFVPDLPTEPVDLIYLCYPNNPSGATISKTDLQKWIDYAREHRALILYDAAYEAFIRDKELPHSIYELPGATEVAVEFRSFSKTAGFTGTRCAYTVVPDACRVWNRDGNPQALNKVWNRRQTTKFNGVSYPVQRAAEAIYSEAGRAQVKALADYYLQNAALILKEMQALGYECIGGRNSPYIWIDTKTDSWDFFDRLLQNAGVVCTPGAGFGRCGEGYIRISAFNHYEKVQEALDRIRTALQ